MELTLWRKAGGELTVRDTSSAVVYGLHRSGPSVKQIFLLKDKAGLPILALRPEHIHTFHHQWKAVRPNGNANIPVFTLKRSLTADGRFCAEVVDNETSDFYSIKGSLSERSYILYTRCSHVVAQVIPKLEICNGKNALKIVVEKGFNVGFIIGIIAIVECINEGRLS